MKAKDLRERSVEDLRELEKSLAKETFQNRFKNFTNRLDDTSSINKTKRDLARVKTILHQLELNAEAKGEAPKKVAAPAKPAKSPSRKKVALKARPKKKSAK
ncbi:MAG: 50S ribosomal protein L29 [Labilithrix sp.]|nr:50S ribosomal protein L29 [Labilithrix sp.]MCW5817605.1 50S ribosomal protein L29 [Labilithrix sp.]